ncbi:MAG: hypothetical protein PHY46_02270, partial [Candidatus Omnitrophica bacterium]|nr:hypothetical protein [Candidatus Omnitrophota bacterium]
RIGNTISGTALATEKTVLWNLGVRGTGINLLTVIAPLQGVIEATSAFTKKYISPSAYTPVERNLWNNTFGAFWNAQSAVKYQNLIDEWGKGGDFKNRLSLAGRFAERAYLSGLFGMNNDGSNKINNLSELKDKFNEKGIGGVLGSLDKDNVNFSAALAILAPLAEPAFSNIRYKNIGKGFQAVGKGMEKTFGELVAVRGIGKEASLSARLMSQTGNMIVTGTIEEALTEQVIQMGLSFIPGLSPQFSEILQEILSPNGYARVHSIPTRKQAEIFVRNRLAEIDAGATEITVGEKSALRRTLRNLTVTGERASLWQTRLDKLNNMEKSGIALSSQQIRGRDTIKASLGLANGSLQYDPTAVTQAMLPYLQLRAEQVAERGRNTIINLANNKSASADARDAALKASAARIEGFAFNTIDRGDGAGKTSSQAKRDSLQEAMLRGGYNGYVAVDVGMNFDFDLGLFGSKTIESNLMAEYNFGQGAHEFMHLSIDDSKDYRRDAWYNAENELETIRSQFGDKIYSSINQLDLGIGENNPNEILVMQHSLRNTLEFVNNNQEFIGRSENSGVHGYLMQDLLREKADFAEIVDYINGLDNKELLSLISNDVIRRSWKEVSPKRLHYKVDSVADFVSMVSPLATDVETVKFRDLSQTALRSELTFGQNKLLAEVEDFKAMLFEKGINIEALDRDELEKRLREDHYAGDISNIAGYHLETDNKTGNRIVVVPEAMDNFATPSGMLADITLKQRIAGLLSGKLNIKKDMIQQYKGVVLTHEATHALQYMAESAKGPDHLITKLEALDEIASKGKVERDYFSLRNIMRNTYDTGIDRIGQWSAMIKDGRSAQVIDELEALVERIEDPKSLEFNPNDRQNQNFLKVAKDLIAKGPVITTNDLSRFTVLNYGLVEHLNLLEGLSKEKGVSAKDIARSLDIQIQNLVKKDKSFASGEIANLNFLTMAKGVIAKGDKVTKKDMKGLFTAAKDLSTLPVKSYFGTANELFAHLTPYFMDKAMSAPKVQKIENARSVQEQISIRINNLLHTMVPLMRKDSAISDLMNKHIADIGLSSSPAASSPISSLGTSLKTAMVKGKGLLLALGVAAMLQIPSDSPFNKDIIPTNIIPAGSIESVNSDYITAEEFSAFVDFTFFGPRVTRHHITPPVELTPTLETIINGNYTKALKDESISALQSILTNNPPSTLEAYSSDFRDSYIKLIPVFEKMVEKEEDSDLRIRAIDQLGYIYNSPKTQDALTRLVPTFENIIKSSLKTNSVNEESMLLESTLAIFGKIKNSSKVEKSMHRLAPALNAVFMNEDTPYSLNDRIIERLPSFAVVDAVNFATKLDDKGLEKVSKQLKDINTLQAVKILNGIYDANTDLRRKMIVKVALEDMIVPEAKKFISQLPYNERFPSGRALALRASPNSDPNGFLSNFEDDVYKIRLSGYHAVVDTVADKKEYRAAIKDTLDTGKWDLLYSNAHGNTDRIFLSFDKSILEVFIKDSITNTMGIGATYIIRDIKRAEAISQFIDNKEFAQLAAFLNYNIPTNASIIPVVHNDAEWLTVKDLRSSLFDGYDRYINPTALALLKSCSVMDTTIKNNFGKTFGRVLGFKQAEGYNTIFGGLGGDLENINSGWGVRLPLEPEISVWQKTENSSKIPSGSSPLIQQQVSGLTQQQVIASSPMKTGAKGLIAGLGLLTMLAVTQPKITQAQTMLQPATPTTAQAPLKDYQDKRVNELFNLAQQPNNRDAAYELANLVRNDNSAVALNALIDLMQQGQISAFYSADYLARKYSNSTLHEFLRTADPYKFADFDPGWKYEVFEVLIKNDNSAALTPFFDIIHQGHVEVIHEVNDFAKHYNNSIAKAAKAAQELLRTADPSKFADLNLKQRVSVFEVLIENDNNAALTSSFDLIQQGYTDVSHSLKRASSERVYRINDLHESLDAVRFVSVENATPQELYVLIVFGEEELVYSNRGTSTAHGLFNRMFNRMGQTSGDQLLKEVNHTGFRTFINIAASFGRLNDFLKTNDSDTNTRLLERFAQGIDKEKDMLAQAVTVADAFASIKDKDILKVLQETVQKEYSRVSQEGNHEGTAIYGLLSGMFAENAVINEGWFKQMQTKYQLADVTGLSRQDLFNQQGKNIQQYFFYDDRVGGKEEKNWDGHHSFKSFLNAYGAQVNWDNEGNITSITQTKPNGWKIELNPDYVLIKSANSSGREIEIYANRPDKQEEGRQAIQGLFGEQNLTPQVVVHRGHSYYVDETIPEIASNTRIVWLGSCGGYNNLASVLDLSPQAAIISTKGTGTMRVNDPLLKMLNEEILNSGSVNWPDFWQKAQGKLANNSDFDQYVSPEKNLGALFIKAYRQLTETDNNAGSASGSSPLIQQQRTGLTQQQAANPTYAVGQKAVVSSPMKLGTKGLIAG